MSSTFRRGGGTNRKKKSNLHVVMSSSASSPDEAEKGAVTSNSLDLTHPKNELHAKNFESDSSNNTTASSMQTNKMPSLRLAGTKPWVGGHVLTSTGHTEWDAMLGGGQPLGQGSARTSTSNSGSSGPTLVLMEQDRHTHLGLTLVKYWCASAVSQGQCLLVVQERSDGVSEKTLAVNLGGGCAADYCGFGWTRQQAVSFLQQLPRDLHYDKFEARKKGQASQEVPSNEGTVGKIDTVLEEDDDYKDDEEEKEKQMQAEEGLDIAWQYRTSVQRARTGALASTNKSKASREEDVYCHSYDLSSFMADQFPSDESDGIILESPNGGMAKVIPCLVPYSPDTVRGCPGIALFRSITHAIEQQLQLFEDQPKVLRVLLPQAHPPTAAKALHLLISLARKRDWPVVFCVTVRPWVHVNQSTTYGSQEALTCLRRLADAVFSVDSFDGLRAPPPPEFAELQGLLHVSKVRLQSLSLMGVGYSKRPPAARYGLKRDRRKLHISMLHLPPEEFSKGGSSVSGGGVRSGGGLSSSSTLPQLGKQGAGCSSGGGGSGGGSVLDF